MSEKSNWVVGKRKEYDGCLVWIEIGELGLEIEEKEYLG
jgi:hypothetical protein